MKTIINYQETVQQALTWAQAMSAYNRGEFVRAIELFTLAGHLDMAVWIKEQQGE